MDDKAFQGFIERIFTPKVQYIMTGAKTRVVVHLPPVLLRGGFTLPRRRYLAEYDIERREITRVIRQD